MAQAMYPENQPGAASSAGPNTPPGNIPSTPPNAMTNTPSSASLRQRPGLVTFAAYMMFLLGAFQLLFAIEEFVRAAWIAAYVGGTFGGALWVWGIVDAVFGFAALYAGFDLLRGGQFGQIFGLIVASLSAIRWFFYIPAAPWVAVVAIIVDVLIIYGLSVHSDYFRTPKPTG
jgi:hypothetical protein